METNYFVCTLGQASRLDKKTHFENITQLLDLQAERYPDTPAVGFFEIGKEISKPWKARILSFADIRRGSLVVADEIANATNFSKRQPIALLCPSSPEFLFVWLALIRLGHPVLLIAPQCSPLAIAGLCRTCEVTMLFHDEDYEELARKAREESQNQDFQLSLERLPFSEASEVFKKVKTTPRNSRRHVPLQGMDVAYLHHTSGTSSGMPKPIAQSHRAGVGVLPQLDGTTHASFTTTPLYHGGVADVFRAWTSQALIWLFPGKDLPITAKNVVSCLDTAAAGTNQDGTPPIRYFSSVPYVLQMMSLDVSGIKHLQGMDVVGVGGAALPQKVGDELVEEGINLVSRFGSAECGFLMSSHRDYASDKDWQFLRVTDGETRLQFERREDGLSELVIMKGWPHMAKTNRDDGSFATSDLFAPHPSLPNAWKYHSRADSQLTLITGKKFDPAPLEDSIAASGVEVEAVLIFGNGKPYPGALLFRSRLAEGKSDEEVLSAIVPIVEKLNSGSPNHARIPRNMLIIMPYNKTGLEKSSKGTVLRSAAESKYLEQIENAYQSVAIDRSDVSDDEIEDLILEVVKSVVGARESADEELTMDTDLFAYGVDSVASIQIHHAISQLLSNNLEPLPPSVVEDCGNTSKLAALVRRKRHGISVGLEDDPHETMRNLVQNYSSFQLSTPVSYPSATRPQQGTNTQVILLTGPTGSLGAHILHQLLGSLASPQIYLLVRGATAHAARERVLKALSARQLSIPTHFDQRVTIFPCKLSEPTLGLSEQNYDLLANTVDVIVHLAWFVNFLLPLSSFAPHLAGLRNLIALARVRSEYGAESRPGSEPRRSSHQGKLPKFIFCSSVASVSNYASLTSSENKSLIPSSNLVPEKIVKDPSCTGPTGYSRSKWVAEQICAAAYDYTPTRSRTQGQDHNHIGTSPSLHKHPKGLDICAVRVGQLCGATDTGVWSKTEAYPLLLSSAKATGVLPDLEQEILGWLPVDLAARAFVDVILRGKGSGANDTEETQDSMRVDADAEGAAVYMRRTDGSEDIVVGSGNEGGDKMPIYHLLNPDEHTTWQDLLHWIQADDQTHDLSSQNETTATDFRAQPMEVVSVNEWLDALSQLQAHPASNFKSNSNSNPTANPGSGKSAKSEKQNSTEGGTDTTAVLKSQQWHAHPATKLLGFWRNTYGSCTDTKHDKSLDKISKGPFLKSEGQVLGPGKGHEQVSSQEHDQKERTFPEPEDVRYAMDLTFAAMPSLRDAVISTLENGNGANTRHGSGNSAGNVTARIVNETYVRKLWNWVQAEM